MQVLKQGGDAAFHLTIPSFGNCRAQPLRSTRATQQPFKRIPGTHVSLRHAHLILDLNYNYFSFSGSFSCLVELASSIVASSVLDRGFEVHCTPPGAFLHILYVGIERSRIIYVPMSRHSVRLTLRSHEETQIYLSRLGPILAFQSNSIHLCTGQLLALALSPRHPILLYTVQIQKNPVILRYNMVSDSLT